MSAVTHTPGPWRVGPVDDTIVTDADGKEVAAIDGDYNSPDEWPRMEANARLIAAAPDLLDALYNAHNYLCMIRGIIAPLPKRDGACAMIECHDSAALIIEHAIAKAEGRS